MSGADTCRVLGLVPARGGSKGVPRKNVRPLAGHSLLAYTATVACQSGVIDRLVLSSEDPEVRTVGLACGLEVPFERPSELAADDTPMIDVVRHALDTLAAQGCRPDIVVLLQPTSPLRKSEHVANAVQRLRAGDADSVVTVVELPRHLSPDYVMKVDDGYLAPFLADSARPTRRQDARPAFVRDGTAYAFFTRTLQEQGSIYGARSVPLVIPAHESLSIDSWDDWREAERRLAAVPTA